jgi:uncharacterized protein (TIGR01777 family)
MKILVTGGTGLIGSEVGPLLVSQGHELIVISRHQKKAQERLTYPAKIIECDLSTQALPSECFAEVQAILHLAGESIDGRWSEGKKNHILRSREQSTINLLKNCPANVSCLVSASALGYYGHRNDEELDENSARGTGFLSDVCEAWEKAVQSSFQQRTVMLRFGVVLSRKGGALNKLVRIFKNHTGAVLGQGTQWMSWLSLTDAARLITESLQNPNMQGVFVAANGVPVTNRQLTRTLADSLDVTLLPPAPAVAVRALLGEMSALVLDSTRATSGRISQFGFEYKDKSLEDFFSSELKPYSGGNLFFSVEQYIPERIENVFRFFSDEKNLEMLTPPFLNFKVEKMSTPQIEQNSLIDYKLKIHGIPIHWQTKIEEWNPPEKFVDFQLKGPYRHWRHLHQFASLGKGTLMKDQVVYRLPAGWLGQITAGSFVLKDIEKIFAYRRQVIASHKFT